MNAFNQSYTRTRLDVIQHIDEKVSRVLDVGCADGSNGRWLLENGIARQVIGIEISESMANVASRDYERVIVGSLDDPLVLPQLNELEPFDCVILGDVLEHLLEPEKVLASILGCVRPGGKVLISVPNMQHFDVFLHLFIKGDWPSNDRGLFDRTHLQQFTRKRLLRLVSDSGLVLLTLHRKYRARDALGSSFARHPFSFLMRLFVKDLFTFQYIAVTRKGAASHRAGDPSALL